MKDTGEFSSDKSNQQNEKEMLRKAAIIDAAQTLFYQQGVNRTTTTMIASKAMVSKRAIYDFFATKDDIYHAVVDKNKKYFVDLPRPVEEDISVFEALIKIFRLDMESHEECSRILFLQSFKRESAESPEMTQDLYASGSFNPREQLIQWIEQQIGAGKIAVAEPDDVGVYAGMLMNIVFGALTPPRSGLDDLGVRKKHITKALKIFLRGIGVNH